MDGVFVLVEDFLPKKTFRIIDSEGPSYIIEDLTDGKISKIPRKVLSRDVFVRGMDPHRHPPIHRLLRSVFRGHYDHMRLRNADYTNLLPTLNYSKSLPRTFTVFRSLLETCVELPPGLTIGVVSDQRLSDSDLDAMMNELEIDPEVESSRIIQSGVFEKDFGTKSEKEFEANSEVLTVVSGPRGCRLLELSRHPSRILDQKPPRD